MLLARSLHVGRSTGRRMPALLGLSLMLAIVLSLFMAPSAAHAHMRAAATVGPKYYYLALGDSLAFGYQPNLDWSHSYPTQWYNSDLSKKGSKS